MKQYKNKNNEIVHYHYEHGCLFKWMLPKDIKFKSKAHNAKSPTEYLNALTEMGHEVLGFNLNSSSEWRGKNTKVVLLKNGVYFKEYSIDSLLFAGNSGDKLSKYTRSNLLYYFNKLKDTNQKFVLMALPKIVNNSTKLEIKCQKGHTWNSSNLSNIKKIKCPVCSRIKKLEVSELLSNTQKSCDSRNFEFLGLVEYRSANSRVNIRCNTCEFEWKPNYNDFVNGCTGCPNCAILAKESKAVKSITEYLEANNIAYVKEQRFADCKNIKTLPFDFYIENHNILIEYDGKQHHSVAWGGEENLKRIQVNDKIKTCYAKDKGINLIRIRFDEDHIEILSNYFRRE